MDLTDRFADAVLGDAVALDAAALLLAAHGDPACDVEASLDRLDGIAAEVPGAAQQADLAAVCHHLFSTMRLAGDRASYYDPRNSYLHLVLERRLGIPISLSVVLIEVGRRLGLELHGVSTPGHFIVAHPRTDQWIDAFDGGRILDRTGVDRLFARIAPGVAIEPYLAPVSPVDVLRRMLSNLLGIFQQCNDRDGLLWASRLRTVLPGAGADDLRPYAGALVANGQFVQAAKVFEDLAGRDDVADPEGELARAARLRARMN